MKAGFLTYLMFTEDVNGAMLCESQSLAPSWLAASTCRYSLATMAATSMPLPDSARKMSASALKILSLLIPLSCTNHKAGLAFCVKPVFREDSVAVARGKGDNTKAPILGTIRYTGL